MTSRKPLEGITVVDFSTMVAGPWCTRLLADCGAQVIKVEATGEGDVLRFAPPFSDQQSLIFAQFNCGKKSVSLDLKSPGGRDVARRLIDRADVVVENFRPGVMGRLGLDYPTVAKNNKKLIYCSVSGFGQTGPMASKAAYAPIMHALSGLDHAFMAVQPRADTPPSSSIMTADVVAAVYAFGAIQTALVRRERFGEGACIDTTLIDSTLSLIGLQLQQAQSDTPVIPKIFSPTRARDGFVMIALVNLRNYQALYPLIGRPEWAVDERFSTLRAILVNFALIEAELATWGATRDCASIVDTMEAAGIAASLYRSPRQALDDEHLRARGSFAPVGAGDNAYVVLNPPFRLSGAPCTANPWVATPGEHARAIMTEFLNASPQEFDQLAREKAFG